MNSEKIEKRERRYPVFKDESQCINFGIYVNGRFEDIESEHVQDPVEYFRRKLKGE